jgi:hemerythrin
MKDIKKLISSYDRFVPHKLLDLLNKKNITEIKLGDQVEQRITILFTDIRGFITLSEELTPQENFNFLNSYLSQMEPIISVNDGIVDKYIGDAIMAIFPDSPESALECALQMLKQLQIYNQGRSRAGYQNISIGIGLNTGLAMIGTVGGYNRMDGTVISDAVNLCSRIESLTKAYELDLLIGESTYNSLSEKHKKYARFMDRVLIKGKLKPQSIYEVFAADAPESRDKKLESKLIFEEALANFHYKNIDTAKTLLRKCCADNPADIPVRIYLQRCDNFLNKGVYEGSSELSDRVSWGEQFILGHEKIDKQHRELVDASISLIEKIETQAGSSLITGLVNDIEEMARIHFTTEETLLKNSDYPLYDYHKLQHETFLISLVSLGKELTKPTLSITFRMFRAQILLLDWLVSHTLSEDRNYKKYINS